MKTMSAMFRDFEFDGYVYHCVCSKSNKGIESVNYSGGVRVTDKERTVIDSIKDMDKISGLEEVIENIQSIFLKNNSFKNTLQERLS